MYPILFFIIINAVISNFIHACGNTCLSICSVCLKADLACLLNIVALQSSYVNISYLWFMSPRFLRNLPIFGVVKLYILPISWMWHGLTTVLILHFLDHLRSWTCSIYYSVRFPNLCIAYLYSLSIFQGVKGFFLWLTYWISFTFRILKIPDAGKAWGQEKKEDKEDEMVGWHYWLKGHEYEQTPGDSKGQRNLLCCSPCGHKELDMTEQLNNIYIYIYLIPNILLSLG